MNDKDAPVEPIDTPDPIELAAIEFESPGRFAVHNPEPITPDAAQWEPAPFILGQHERLERFSQPQQARAHILALIQQAQRSLCLYSDDLEPWLYHHSSVQQACTRFLLSSPRARLRILLRGRPCRKGRSSSARPVTPTVLQPAYPQTQSGLCQRGTGLPDRR